MSIALTELNTSIEYAFPMLAVRFAYSFCPRDFDIVNMQTKRSPIEVKSRFVHIVL